MFILHQLGFYPQNLNKSRVYVIFPQSPRPKEQLISLPNLRNPNTHDYKMIPYLNFGLLLLLFLLPLLPLLFSSPCYFLFSPTGALAKNETNELCLSQLSFYTPISPYCNLALNLSKISYQLLEFLLWPISTHFMIFISLMAITILSLF